MFGHTFITGNVKRFFVNIRDVFTQAQVTVPVLYMHGDGHTFSMITTILLSTIVGVISRPSNSSKAQMWILSW
jgi:hypothetical protein